MNRSHRFCSSLPTRRAISRARCCRWPVATQAERNQHRNDNLRRPDAASVEHTLPISMASHLRFAFLLTADSMNERKAIIPPEMEAVYKNIRYAPAIKVGNTIYVSGQ